MEPINTESPPPAEVGPDPEPFPTRGRKLAAVQIRATLYEDLSEVEEGAGVAPTLEVVNAAVESALSQLGPFHANVSSERLDRD